MASLCQFAKMTTIILLGKASDKHVVCLSPLLGNSADS